jgi:hypothetical protein
MEARAVHVSPPWAPPLITNPRTIVAVTQLTKRTLSHTPVFLIPNLSVGRMTVIQ